MEHGTPADREAIAELKHAYCWHYDTGDLDALMRLFTADAVCDLDAFGSWRSAEEIRQGYARQMAATGIPGTRLHSVSNPVIRVNGDRAKGWWYLVDYNIEPGCTAPVRILATYDDDYLRTEEGWRIERTRLSIRWRCPE
ncbi:nuclear transport factor 2 family protein [Thermobifida halotolerans]|uniref:Nuclear transport factor 2 family protein n=1 Tax=Thermobifida halotolerans TaxID=483545 RepID=A0A399G1J1_9ACTN|nr:nuclear transport factor 2 family protein [Thermobifida halotolerans]UOE21236.1 nuclear transport factor 2 family protein [Thermobifida halotolerans]